jgi:phenylalanyl-tRNA synthetase beta chain
MKISLNTIRQMNERYHTVGDIAAYGVEKLVERIGAQLGEVEEVTEIGKKYEGIIIAKVLTCEKHPNADRLNVCMIDDGGKAEEGVARDENGHVQVVCGAPNVRAGLTVAWLPPGATVPESYDKDPFVLDARELRGVVSNGMLASPKELALGDSHAGILEIEDEVTPGTSFAEKYDLKDDVIIDIENKMFTHRPDCFGFLGISRELAGIQQIPFQSPEWYRVDATIPGLEAEGLKLEVRNELPELVPRFTAVTMRDVAVGPSPVWLQVELAKLGQRSINNIVDYTNYFMLLTGQPLHAYDYDKVKALSGGEAATIVVRHPHEGEKILLLNGKEVAPRAEAIMIATDQKAIGIGGVMGGGETEVDETTKNIILECANFNMYSIRRTSMAHGLFTDAVTRFNKGQSPLQNKAVLGRVVDEIRSHANGKISSELIDHVDCDKINIAGDGWVDAEVEITPEFVNSRLGLQLSSEEIVRLLKNVEFGADVNGENIKLYAPFWRTDIEISEDVVEEVGRLYGYDHLSHELPKRAIVPVGPDALLQLKDGLRRKLASYGANEVLSYSFVPEKLLQTAGQDSNQAFKVTNALSPELQYYRLSVTPSLLEKVHPNLKAGHRNFVLFEIGKTHLKSEKDPVEPEVPKEVNGLALIYAMENRLGKQSGAAFYQARNYLDELLVSYGAHTTVTYEPLQGADLYHNPWLEQMTAAYEPSRSAVLRAADGLVWGVVGEFKASTRQKLKLPEFTAGFELDPLLFLQDKASSRYVPLARFPELEQDLTLKVASEVSFQSVRTVLASAADMHKPEDVTVTVQPLGIYQAEDDTTHKNFTFRFTLVSNERTLTTDLANSLLDTISSDAQKQLAAERI